MPQGCRSRPARKVAKLTTDATNLVSDTTIRAPGIELTGTGKVLTALPKRSHVGTVTATNIDATTITATVATGALVSRQRCHHGELPRWRDDWFRRDGWNTATVTARCVCMRYRNPSRGAVSPLTYCPVVTVRSTLLHVFDIYVQYAGPSGPFSSSTQRRTISVGAAACGLHGHSADPGAANYPDGTILG